MTFESGKQFGQYRLLRLLGRGGMGEVYEAEHRVLQRRYALKLLPEDFASRPEAVRRFEREAAVMANLEHRNIVRVDDFGDTDGRYWLRMELVEGVEPEVISLADFAAKRGGKVPEPEFAAILHQLLEGLAHAHGKGVVHRDLKPANVLLKRGADGQLWAKVSDFGLALVIGEEFIRSRAQASSSGGGNLTGVPQGQTVNYDVTKVADGSSTRALLGTYEYMSPEQKRGEEADVRSDVYAVGLMCYRLLTGQDLGRKAITQLVTGLNQAWDDMVDKALEAVAADRYADSREMLSTFKALAIAAKGEEAARLAAKTQAEEEAARQRQEEQQRRKEQREREEARVRLDQRVAEEACRAAEAEAQSRLAVGRHTEEQKRQETERLARRPQPGKPWENSLGLKFVPVPGTEVLFCVWETRVQDYRAYADDNSGVDKSWMKPGFPQGDDHPVVKVSWNDAKAFCQWLSRKEGQQYRLPTDAEWSYAVGIGDRESGNTPAEKDRKLAGVYPWGTQWPPPIGAGNYGKIKGGWLANFLYDSGFGFTAPVGSFKGNAHGIYDLGGNVWEWCEDEFSPGFRTRALRGAAWNDGHPEYLLSSYRISHTPNDRCKGIGFRVVLVVGGSAR